MNPATNVRSIIPYIGSMSFDGVNDFNLIASHPSLQLNSYAIECRIQIQSGVAALGEIVTSRSGENHFLLRVNANGTVALIDWTGNSGATIASTARLDDNLWHHILAQRSGPHLSVYVDGVLVASAETATGSVAYTNSSIYLGSNNLGAGSFLRARVSKVAIYNIATRLTNAEVLSNFLHGTVPSHVASVLNLETTANQIKGNQWLDKSGNNNHATIVGSTFSYESPTKRIAQIGAQRQLDGRFDGVVSGGVTIAGGAMVFDGVNGRVNCGNNAALQRFERLTIYGWCNSTNLGTNKEIIQKRDISNSRFGLTLGSNNKIYFTVANGTDSKDTISPNNYPTGVNFLVYGEYDGSEARLYVNNELVKTEAYTGNVVAVGGGLIIGARDSGGLNPMNGLVLTTALFNRILTADQRTAIFNAGPNAPCPVKHGLVAEWSGRDWEGPAATPTKVFSVASWDGLNVQ
jgi:hypothetical protein